MGIFPLSVSVKSPNIGETLLAVGVPQDNIPLQNQVLRISKCNVDHMSDVTEGTYYFDDSIANRCSLAGGSSGSPLISQTSGLIVGLENTGSEDNSSAIRSQPNLGFFVFSSITSRINQHWAPWDLVSSCAAMRKAGDTSDSPGPYGILKPRPARILLRTSESAPDSLKNGVIASTTRSQPLRAGHRL